MQVIINWEKIGDKQKDLITGMIESFISTLHREIRLNSLESITFCNDFKEEVTSFQKRHGLRIGYTENELGVAGAKALSYVEDGEYKVSIFLSPALLNYMLGTNDDISMVVHTLHHELCHVYEGSVAYKLYGMNIEDCFDNPSSKIKFAHAEVLWSEYIATALSAGTMNENNGMYFEPLREAIVKVNQNCKELLSEGGELNYQLFGEIQLQTNYLFKLCGYFLGYFHSPNIIEEKREAVIDELFKEEEAGYFKPFFLEIESELLRLRQLFPRWESVHELEGLADTIYSLWNAMIENET